MSIPTFGELRQEIQESIKGEGIEAPSNERINRVLNRAKDQVVGLLEGLFEDEFNNTISYSVAAGDTGITLPDGITNDVALGLTGGDTTTFQPAFRRLNRLVRTDRGYDTPVVIRDHRERRSGQVVTGMVGDAPIMSRLGRTLIFHGTSGAHSAMTLELDYAQTEADITGLDDSARFSTIPGEWTDLLVYRAVSDIAPAAHPARGKYIKLWEQRVGEMQDYRQNQFKDRPAQVQHESDGADYHDSLGW